jgi:propionate CoA-transferase
MRPQFISAQEAAGLYEDGFSMASTGFMMSTVAEEVCAALEKRFLKTGKPEGLTLLFSSGQGDWGPRGLTHFGHRGLVKRLMGAHYGEIPGLVKLVNENAVEAYNLPQGVVSQLYRMIAGKKPGVITKVGLKTYVDPRRGGGKLTDITTEDYIQVIDLAGEEWLFYPSIALDIGLIRGTTADERGNITMEKECMFHDAMQIAQAVRNSGGIVVVQVERKVKAGTLHPMQVKIPGIYVDFVVVADPENNLQTCESLYNPAYSGEIRVPLQGIPPITKEVKRIISRRAILEIFPDAVLNLGQGIPEGVAIVAAEEGLSEVVTLTVEAGAIGGVPAGDLAFGASTNAEAIIDMPSQFDFYDGGGVDITYLGLAQLDGEGNVNVTRFGPTLPGCGGFINISQNSKKAVYCGSFTTKGLDIRGKDGKLHIGREGSIQKMVKKVDQVTFSGEYAREVGQPVLYITERAVFEISPEGVVLTEIAPGVDLDRDVLGQMQFEPVVSEHLKQMDPRIFTDEVMHIRDEIMKKEHRDKGGLV